jgi:hypothetical protein
VALEVSSPMHSDRKAWPEMLINRIQNLRKENRKLEITGPHQGNGVPQRRAEAAIRGYSADLYNSQYLR